MLWNWKRIVFPSLKLPMTSSVVTTGPHAILITVVKFHLRQAMFNFAFFPLGISMTFLFLFSCRYTWWALSVPSPSTPTLHCDLVSQWEQSFPSVLCMQVPAAVATCTVADFFPCCCFWGNCQQYLGRFAIGGTWVWAIHVTNAGFSLIFFLLCRYQFLPLY